MSIQNRSFFTFALVVLHLCHLPFASATFEGNDYITPSYALSHHSKADTSSAQQAIIKTANDLAQSGPWSARSKDTVAASGDSKDYLSWAPYWWPDCNWCNSPTNSSSTTTETWKARRSHRRRLDDSSSTSNAFFTVETDAATSSNTSPLTTTDTAADAPYGTVAATTSAADEEWGLVYQPAYKQNGAQKASRTSNSPMSTSATITPSPDLANTTSSPNTATTIRPAISSTSSSCRPSPTTSMAPSATYTGCPYIRKDGQVNPDVRTLPGSTALTHATQATILNALAYALTGNSEHASNAVRYIRTFFLDPETRINPSAAYAQVIRGPPGIQEGGYEGVLDFRSLVKIVNAVQVLRASGSPEWTNDVEEGMRSWAEKYLGWLQGSAQGQKAKSVSNNHATFYYNQLVSLQMLLDDNEGARSSLQAYFSGPFQHQIDASGEQPYEASRSRPFHYRCFNIEAMITNAKLGTSLGLDFWTTRTNPGSTIQSAVDYAMQLNPGSEDGSELLPHIAAVAAVYGDPDGRYKAFLDASGIDYQSQTWWFYDQPEALDSSARSKRELEVAEDGDETIEINVGGHHFNPVSQTTTPWFSSSSTSTQITSTSLAASSYANSSSTPTSAPSASTSNPSSASVFQPTPGPMPPSPPDDGNSTSLSSSTLLSTTAAATSSTQSPFLMISEVQRVKAESS